jgi:hypothetical protein
MRYRLRTLLIAAGLGPPLLALLWFGAIWASHVHSAEVHRVLHELALACSAVAIALVVYAAVAPPPGSGPSVAVSFWHLSLLGCTVFLALWHWLYLICMVGGWLFIWGDRGPPFSNTTLTLFPALLALCSATLVALRIHLGLATVNYVLIMWCASIPLLALATIFWLGYLLR